MVYLLEKSRLFRTDSLLFMESWLLYQGMYWDSVTKGDVRVGAIYWSGYRSSVVRGFDDDLGSSVYAFGRHVLRVNA